MRIARVGGLVLCGLLLGTAACMRDGAATSPGRHAAADARLASAALVAFRTGTPPTERWGFRTPAGRVVIAPRFAYATDFREQRARAWVPAPASDPEQDGGRSLWGYLAPSGEWAIAPRFDAAGDFEGGRALVRQDDEFVFVDPDGRAIGSLRDAGDRRALPLPSEDCASLADYIEALAPASSTHALIADPRSGESALRLEVRKLGYGALDVRERGWEGESRLLVLPGADLEDGRRIVARLLRRVPHRDITGDGVFGDAVTYELTDGDAVGGEFLGIRRRTQGGIVIHHTRWFG